MMQPHRDMNPESGKPPTAPHLLIPGAPRPTPSQGRGMEGLKPGTRVSTMDPEGPMTRVTDILVHPGRVQRAHRLAALGKGLALRGPSHSHLSRLEQPERCPSRVTPA